MAEPSSKDNAHHLLQHGYVVLPALTPAQRTDLRSRYMEALKHCPEYKRMPGDASRTPGGDPVVYALGGFGCLAHPSSFHFDEAREFREIMLASAMPSLSEACRLPSPWAAALTFETASSIPVFTGVSTQVPVTGKLDGMKRVRDHEDFNTSKQKKRARKCKTPLDKRSTARSLSPSSRRHPVRKVCVYMERTAVRGPGTIIGADAFHRDTSPPCNVTEGDWIFGSILNVENESWVRAVYYLLIVEGNCC